MPDFPRSAHGTTVEPPIMDPPTRGQPLCKDTGYGTDWDYPSAYYSDSNLPPEDSLQAKDKISAPKVSFIRRLHCNVHALYVHVPITCCNHTRIHSCECACTQKMFYGSLVWLGHARLDLRSKVRQAKFLFFS